MIPTKTTEEIIRATLKKSGFKSTPYIPLLDANERWVSVDVLQQKLPKLMDVINAEIEYNELRGFAGRQHYPRGKCQSLVHLFKPLKEFLAGLEPEEENP